MAPTILTKANLLTRVYADLGQQNSTDNELLTSTDVYFAIELGEAAFARDTHAYRRTATLTAVDEQATYDLPEDMHDILAVTYDDALLQRLQGRDAARAQTDWRQADASTPSYWWRETAGSIRLYPPPDVTDETFEVDGYCIPFSIGNNISTISQATTVLTVVTAAPHNLRVGDAVTVAKVATQTAHNGAYTVASVTASTNTFTCTKATATVAEDTTGYVYYTGGRLPMVDTTDVVPFKREYGLAPAYYAVAWLAGNHLAGDGVAQAAGQAAAAKYQAMVAQACEETWI